MFKKHTIWLMMTATLVWLQANIMAQEFPIAVGTDTTFSSGASFDGSNCLIAIYGDAVSQNSITAQLVDAQGNLVGSRISFGATGVMPGAVTVFDGTNYLLVWRAFNGNLEAQFIDMSGNLVGGSFTIATNTLLEMRFFHRVAFDGSNFMVAFVKNDGYLYGQRVSTAGSLVGGQIQISSNFAREISIAYDGTNFLLVWVKVIPGTDKDIYGQFVSTSGTLVGSNFLIDGGQDFSDNPTTLAFDGTRYLMTYHECPDTLGTAWTLLGRFITTAGAIEETITICDPVEYPFYPAAAFDGDNYLITWQQGSNMSLMGRFYDTSGNPVDAAFIIFGSTGNKIPIGAAGFAGNQYLAVATRVDSSFSDGDVYGRFIQPLATGIEDGTGLTPREFSLLQNYPNPFNPGTTFRFSLGQPGFTTLKVFDLAGKELATLVSEEMVAGMHVATWNAADYPSGVYFCQLKSGRLVQTRKMVLVK